MIKGARYEQRFMASVLSSAALDRWGDYVRDSASREKCRESYFSRYGTKSPMSFLLYGEPWCRSSRWNSKPPSCAGLLFDVETNFGWFSRRSFFTLREYGWQNVKESPFPLGNDGLWPVELYEVAVSSMAMDQRSQAYTRVMGRSALFSGMVREKEYQAFHTTFAGRRWFHSVFHLSSRSNKSLSSRSDIHLAHSHNPGHSEHLYHREPKRNESRTTPGGFSAE